MKAVYCPACGKHKEAPKRPVPAQPRSPHIETDRDGNRLIFFDDCVVVVSIERIRQAKFSASASLSDRVIHA